MVTLETLVNKCIEYSNDKNICCNSWDYQDLLMKDFNIDYSLAHKAQVEYFNRHVKSKWGYPWNKRG